MSATETLVKDDPVTTSAPSTPLPHVPLDSSDPGQRSISCAAQSITYADSTSLVSTFSTNYTMSNLIGAGRTLGGLYSRAGRVLERYFALAAHKAGYGPQAVYNKLLVTKTKRRKDETHIVKLCKKLFAYARADQTSTRLLAVERLISFLDADLAILSVYLTYEGLSARTQLARIVHEMQAIPTARLSRLEQLLQIRSEELYFSLDVHCDGVLLLSQNDGQELDRKRAFYGLLSKLLQPESTVIALEYFSSWLNQSANPLINTHFLLELCSVFKKVLRDAEVRDVLALSSIASSNRPPLSKRPNPSLNFIDVCAALHARIVSELKTSLALDAYQQGDIDETVLMCDTVVHIPTLIRMMNEFVEICEEDRMRQYQIKNRFNASDIETIKQMEWLRVERTNTGTLSDILNPSGHLTTELGHVAKINRIPQLLKWKRAKEEMELSGCLIAGYENDVYWGRSDVYLARVFYKGAIYPGKFSSRTYPRASFSKNGAEYFAPDFELAEESDKVKWVPFSGRFKPEGLKMVIGGCKRLKKKKKFIYKIYYFARATFKTHRTNGDNVHCGKVWAGSLASISYGVKAHLFKNYEVLVLA